MKKWTATIYHHENEERISFADKVEADTRLGAIKALTFKHSRLDRPNVCIAHVGKIKDKAATAPHILTRT